MPLSIAAVIGHNIDKVYSVQHGVGMGGGVYGRVVRSLRSDRLAVQDTQILPYTAAAGLLPLRPPLRPVLL